jgi:hypothetical protein
MWLNGGTKLKAEWEFSIKISYACGAEGVFKFK